MRSTVSVDRFGRRLTPGTADVAAHFLGVPLLVAAKDYTNALPLPGIGRIAAARASSIVRPAPA
jgi:hypothetical protein